MGVEWVSVRGCGRMSRPGRRGCCALLHLREDNARFVLLFIVMGIYMLAGAGIFMLLEAENETTERKHYQDAVDTFLSQYPEVNRSRLQTLLDLHGRAETAGIVGDKRPRWDFPGAFYFVGTVVSTIGKTRKLNNIDFPLYISRTHTQ